jgi:8-oxo-dGTP diphosphatase
MSREVECQVWLVEGDRRIFGEEGAKLLTAIGRLGSLPEAAEAAGMSAEGARKLLSQIWEAGGMKVAAGPENRCYLTDEGQALLDEYGNKKRRAEEQLAHAFKNPTLTADGIVMVDGRIVLVRRGREPGKGKYALPGGFVEHGERAEDCAVREVLEETGLRTAPLDLLGVYSDPCRDPRGHIVSTVFRLRLLGGELRAGDDAEGAFLFDPGALPDMAFDHARIIADHLRSRR